MKKLLALFLALLLALGIGAPALADYDDYDPCPYCETHDPCPRTPVITRQPEDIRVSLRVQHLEHYLIVGAYLPIGNTWTTHLYKNGVRVSWNIRDYISLEVNQTVTHQFHVVVYNHDHPGHYAVSETVQVEFYLDPCSYCELYDPCPRMPVMTQQPQDSVLRHGQRYVASTLRASISVPRNLNLTYRWYRDDTFIHSGRLYAINLDDTWVQRTVSLVGRAWDDGIGIVDHPVIYATESAYYHVVVYNSAHPDHYIISERARLEVYEPTAWQLFQEGFLSGFMTAMFPFAVTLWGQMLMTFGGPLFFITLPFAAPVLIVFGLGGALFGLPLGLIAGIRNVLAA